MALANQHPPGQPPLRTDHDTLWRRIVRCFYLQLFHINNDVCVCVSVLDIFSGILSALGNLLSQILEARKKAKNGAPVDEIDTAGATRFAIFG